MENQQVLEAVRTVIRRRNMSRNTEETYLYWIERFMLHNNHRDPHEYEEEAVCRYLSGLTANQNLSASTRNLALSAVLFLYNSVLKKTFDCLGNIERVQRPRTLPTVFSRDEVAAVIGRLKGVYTIIAGLLYGSGLRLQECLHLRVRDIEFQNGTIVVQPQERCKERTTLLPESLREPLQEHLRNVRDLHRVDLEEGYGETVLPEAIARNHPEYAGEWRWQYVFPAAHRSSDRQTGTVRRSHLDASAPQRAIKRAIREAGVTESGSVHTLRHSFALHLLEDGCALHTVQELLGHANVRTTMSYMRLLTNDASSVRSPLDSSRDDP